MNFLRNCIRDTIMNSSNRQSDTPNGSNSSHNGDTPSSSTSYIRRAHHAGSWYSSDPNELDNLLTKFLADATMDMDGKCSSSTAGDERCVPNACISPHAGFRYSGPTAAYSYLALGEALRKNPSLRTVVVLHPSHHVYLDGCAVSGASKIETPLGDLKVDVNLRERLLSTSKFDSMKRQVDEEEHSGEMQYPFIAKIIKDTTDNNGKRHDVSILPIMIGSIQTSKEEEFGKLLSPYLSHTSVFTVISSDFCHWGKRFSYTPQPSKLDNSIKTIYEYIEHLDRMGMDLIELQRPGAFADYLRNYSNTICGRHPISVWLHSVQESTLTHDIRFLKYDQSEKAHTTNDHSVSYAGAVSRVEMMDT